MCTKFGYERATSPYVNLRVDERIILKWAWGMDNINQVQGRENWQALVNAAMNLGVP
jgi:hypothetical protein